MIAADSKELAKLLPTETGILNDLLQQSGLAVDHQDIDPLSTEFRRVRRHYWTCTNRITPSLVVRAGYVVAAKRS